MRGISECARKFYFRHVVDGFIKDLNLISFMEKVVIEQTQMKRPIWDYLFYFFLSILTLWLILKVVGIIQTPLWLEYGVSIGSAIGTIAALFQSINKKFEKVDYRFDRVFGEMSILHSNVARIDGKLVHIDRDLERIKDTVFAK